MVFGVKDNAGLMRLKSVIPIVGYTVRKAGRYVGWEEYRNRQEVSQVCLNGIRSTQEMKLMIVDLDDIWIWSSWSAR